MAYSDKVQESPELSVLDLGVGIELKSEVGCFRISTQYPVHAGPFSEVWLATDEQEINRSLHLRLKPVSKDLLRESPMFQRIVKTFFDDSEKRYETEKHVLRKLVGSDTKHLIRLVATVDQNNCFDERRTPGGIKQIPLESKPFIVTEYIDGESFAKLVKHRDLDTVIKLIPQLQELLKELEQNGIVHRDISPNNLLLDNNSHLWLIDFGSCYYDREQPDLWGEGTRGYRSPEVRIKTKELTPQADQYSVACVLFSLVTGLTIKPEIPSPNYDNEKEITECVDNIAKMLARSSADKELIDTFLKALSSNAVDRFNSSQEFLEHIEAGLKRLERKLNGLGPLEEERKKLLDKQILFEVQKNNFSDITDAIEQNSEILTALQQSGHVSDKELDSIKQGIEELHLIEQRFDKLKEQEEKLESALKQHDQAIAKIERGGKYQSPENVSLDLITGETEIHNAENVLNVFLTIKEDIFEKVLSKISKLQNSEKTSLSPVIVQTESILDSLNKLDKEWQKQATALNREQQSLHHRLKKHISYVNGIKEKITELSSLTQTEDALELIKRNLSRPSLNTHTLRRYMDELGLLQKQITETALEVNQLQLDLNAPENNNDYWKDELKSRTSNTKKKLILSVFIASILVLLTIQVIDVTKVYYDINHSNLIAGQKSEFTVTSDGISDNTFRLEFGNNTCEYLKTVQNNKSIYSCISENAGELEYRLYSEDNELLKSGILTVYPAPLSFNYKVTPKDASIYIDNQLYNGQAITGGKHHFKVIREGYNTFSDMLDYSINKGLNIHLAPTLVNLEINVSPEEAKIYLYEVNATLNIDENKNLLPSSLQIGRNLVPTGSYKFIIKKDGYISNKQIVNLIDDTALNITLSKTKGLNAYEAKDYSVAYKEIIRLADQGEPWAQYKLGWMYQEGRGVPQSDKKAVAWYRKAADLGNASAQYELGWIYQEGRGVPQSDKEAVAWYRRAADQGNAFAQYDLGWMYQEGRGVPQSDKEAVAWYRRAADLGNASAQNNLGWMYQEGLGVPQSDKEAVAWYRKAADLGNASAQNNLGWMYQGGRGVPQSDKEAVAWFRRAAKQGDASAQNNLGWMYQEGLGVPQSDKEAVAWFHKAADQGYASAQNNLGWMYQRGLGVPQSDKEAVAWFHKAADQGNAFAQNNLGWMYQRGLGVPQSDKEAVTWFRKAADQGNASALYKLGWMYENGLGVSQSNTEAIAWYQKAAKQGSVTAKYSLKRIYPEAQWVTLTVRSNQYRDNVVVDDINYGSTPVDILLPAGSHMITVEKDGFSAVHQKMKLTSDQTLRANLKAI